MTRLAEQVKDYTDALNNVPEFLDAASNVLSTPAGWLVLLAVLVWLMLNKGLYRSLNFVEKSRNKRLEAIEKYISEGEIGNEDITNTLKDFRDKHFFRVATGIEAEGKFRSTLIKLHRETSSEINWTHIRRASSYIKESEDGTIFVSSLSWTEKIGYYYNKIIGFVFLFFGAAIFILLLTLPVGSLKTIVLSIIGALSFIGMAMYIYAQNWPVESAKKISKELHGGDIPKRKNIE